MEYPAKLVRRLGNSTDGILYVKYLDSEINIVNGNNITSIKINGGFNCCELHGDYIYYSTSAVDANKISVHKICVSTLDNIILFTIDREIYGNLIVLDTAIGVLIVLDIKVFTESGEYLPVFVDGCIQHESKIIHYNNEIIVSMNIFSEEQEDKRIIKIGQFAIFSLISKKRIFASNKSAFTSTRRFIVRETDFESECENVIYEIARKIIKEDIGKFQERIKVLNGSRIILSGNLIQLNHHVAEIPECYVCGEEIYIKQTSQVYICSHPDTAHEECLRKTKCCPLCREPKR